ncbi:MAG: alpha/beta fold hydrolase, partial [Acidobacteriota bacterium]
MTIEDGSSVDVETGLFLVPENRQRLAGPLISIPFYRLRSTAAEPASPIFLLAGGPGSSWIDRFEKQENFAEVERYRAIADVVLFDQRGGGHSKPSMTCDERRQLPLDKPLDQKAMAAELRDMAAACRDHWLAAGIDLAAYNTLESTADVLALRRALGYRTMSLVGGSYGSHLALALMREAPESIDRVVLYGVEGPDHTWDDPAGRLATYERIAGVAEASAELGPSIPDRALLDTVHAAIRRLEAEPTT